MQIKSQAGDRNNKIAVQRCMWESAQDKQPEQFARTLIDTPGQETQKGGARPKNKGKINKKIYKHGLDGLESQMVSRLIRKETM